MQQGGGRGDVPGAEAQRGSSAITTKAPAGDEMDAMQRIEAALEREEDDDE